MDNSNHRRILTRGQPTGHMSSTVDQRLGHLIAQSNSHDLVLVIHRSDPLPSMYGPAHDLENRIRRDAHRWHE